MAKYRFKGSERHSVPVLGRYVDPKEVVEVPDDVAAQYAWSEDMWAEVTAPSPKARKAAAEARATAPDFAPAESDEPAKDGE